MIFKILKWTGIVLGCAILILLTGYAIVSLQMNKRINKTYSFEKEAVVISNDSATIARGEHLTIIKGCTDCHGKNLAGRPIVDDFALGRIVASNLTPGKGGIPRDYDAADWVNALRHGIGKDNQPLIFMPSHETTFLSKQDMNAIIAYCQQVVPVDNILPDNDLGPVVMVMSYLDKMPLLSVERIDHKRPLIAQADSSEGVAQGKYLSVSCSGCHRENLKGGEPVAPGFPPVPNITSSGNVGKWSKDQFIKTLRTGKTPEGHLLKNEDMPWQMTAQYTQSELSSLYAYLQSIK